MSNENKETHLPNAVLNVGSCQGKDCCFVSCAGLLDVLQSSLHLQLRLASQQLSASHCNYCACSLDIFHKSSQIAKFFHREEKKAKEREAVETQLVTHYQQSFECSKCLL